MALNLMGKKKGMTQLFDEDGSVIVCTVIEIEPNVVVQVKTEENDGYRAVQTGFDKIVTKDPRTIEKRVRKPLLGHFKKASVEPRRHLCESRMDENEEWTVGQEFGVEVFKEVPYVDATGTSIGKGFQGAMKLHNFSGMKASHGTGPVHRSLGSTGNRSTPGRCFPGGKRASQMGNRQVTTHGLRVVMVDEENQLILVKGSVPGPRNSVITLRKAKKK